MEWSADEPAEASRAKHKFAAKRNSWPRTRGVAMNPVDHVSALSAQIHDLLQANDLSSLMEVVITSISARPRQSIVTLQRVRRLVSLRRAGRVCCVVHRRLRIKGGCYCAACSECGKTV